MSKKTYSLNQDQFNFLKNQEEVIVTIEIERIKGNTAPLHQFIRNEDFQILFGGMGWDDIIDRYIDTPGYDATLLNEALEQVRDEEVQFHERKAGQDASNTSDVTEGYFGKDKLDEIRSKRSQS